MTVSPRVVIERWQSDFSTTSEPKSARKLAMAGSAAGSGAALSSPLNLALPRWSSPATQRKTASSSSGVTPTAPSAPLSSCAAEHVLAGERGRVGAPVPAGERGRWVRPPLQSGGGVGSP